LCGFLNRYPDHFVSPLRVSGSAVESLFSQYKRLAGGKLDAANDTVSRVAQLVEQTVSGHHSGTGYRDLSLDTLSDVQLKKKKYDKIHKS